MDHQGTGDHHQAALEIEQKTGCSDIQLGNAFALVSPEKPVFE